MNTRVTLALILMLTFAVGKTVEKKPDEVRRFLERLKNPKILNSMG